MLDAVNVDSNAAKHTHVGGEVTYHVVKMCTADIPRWELSQGTYCM